MIPKCKTGDCSKCGSENTSVVKIAKDLFCLSCNREIKSKKYAAKTREANKVRKLGKQQVINGNYFEAERQVLIKDLDFVTSRIVRYIGSDENGLCTCYTCGYQNHWSFLQCGHFADRQHMELRFDYKRNCRPQCKKCNEDLDGNLIVYAQKLNEEQPGLAEQLIEISREPYHMSREELKQLLIDYRNKLRILEQKFVKDKPPV